MPAPILLFGDRFFRPILKSIALLRQILGAALLLTYDANGKDGIMDDQLNSPATEDRRNFLKSCGRFAATVPPAMTILLSTSLSSEAIAASSGGGGGGSKDAGMSSGGPKDSGGGGVPDRPSGYGSLDTGIKTVEVTRPKLGN